MAPNQALQLPDKRVSEEQFFSLLKEFVFRKIKYYFCYIIESTASQNYGIS